MTESEWWVWHEPQKMLEFLHANYQFTERKARLFAVACCRRIGQGLIPECRDLLDLTEAVMDARAGRDQFDPAFARLRAAVSPGWFGGETPDGWEGHQAVAFAQDDEGGYFRCVKESVAFAAVAAVGGLRRPGRHLASVPEYEAQARLLRDLFGPLPFRSMEIPAAILAWNDNCIPKLAASIYEEWAFTAERMGVLADAMEEAGVTDEGVLQHLRRPALHCRGCWVIDLLLGKE